MKVEYGGPESGPGATYAWKGNKEVGEGRMTILDATPSRRVQLRLEFLAPMKDEASTSFDLAPAGDGTEVTWSMAGQLGFVGKAMCLVTSMDRMVGPDFERGLSSLKSTAEAEAQHPTATAK
jgi:carbon monoxide dehydrogenase subunit G